MGRSGRLSARGILETIFVEDEGANLFLLKKKNLERKKINLKTKINFQMLKIKLILKLKKN